MQRLLADAYLFAAALGAGADHVALGKDAVLDEVHVLNGAERLLRVLLVVGFDIAHPQQRDAGVGAVALQLAQIGAEDQDLVLGDQGRGGGDAGEVDGGLIAAAQFKGGVPQHHQLKGTGILPCVGRVVVKAPGCGGAGQPLHTADHGVVEFH